MSTHPPDSQLPNVPSSAPAQLGQHVDTGVGVLTLLRVLDLVVLLFGCTCFLLDFVLDLAGTFFGVAMRRLLSIGVMFLGFAVLTNCTACHQPETPTTQLSKPKPIPIDYHVLARDYQTAVIYTGIRVIVQLTPDQYRVEVVNGVTELHVWAGTKSGLEPCALIFRCTMLVSVPNKSIVVTGTCKEPIMDGVWRSARCNYCVIIDECVVSY